MAIYEIFAIYIFITCVNIRLAHDMKISELSSLGYMLGCIPGINIIILGFFLYHFYIEQAIIFRILETPIRWLRNRKYKKTAKLVQQGIINGELNSIDPFGEEIWSNERTSIKKSMPRDQEDKTVTTRAFLRKNY